MAFVCIVGGGISGCMLARQQVRAGHRVLLLEKEAQLGGLARTFRYGDFRFDIGPHRFFTNDPQVEALLGEVFGEDLLRIPRRSEVYFCGKYHTWPLRPTTVFKLPPRTTLRALGDLLRTSLSTRSLGEASFETYILEHYGPSLYHAFFKDYTEKFLGLPAGELHADWAREGMRRVMIDERLAHRELLDILALMLRFNPPPTWCWYPPEGIGSFCERLGSSLSRSGVTILPPTRVQALTVRRGAIEALHCEGETHHPERVIWTGPLAECAELLQLSAQGLSTVALLCYNLELSAPPLRHFQWCYYGSPGLLFSRISIPSEFSPTLTPPGHGSLCVELTTRQGSALWHQPEQVLPTLLRQLVQVGILTDTRHVLAVHCERIADAYPLYHRGYQDQRDRVLAYLATIGNLRLAGRGGRFWYNNMDDCIAATFDAEERATSSPPDLAPDRLARRAAP